MSRKMTLFTLLVACVVGAVVLLLNRWSIEPSALDSSPPVVQEVMSVSAPNVVVVIGCTVRADQLGAWGGEALTPNIDKLAKNGARFEMTLAQTPWTRPAASSILTGLYPEDTGIVEMGPGRNENILHPNSVTLAERFHHAGYTTVGATANSNLNAVFGFDQGFDHYSGTKTLWRKGIDKVHGVELVGNALTTLKAENVGERPFYLQLTMVDSHLPMTLKRSEFQAQMALGVSKRVASYRAMLGRLDGAIGGLHDGLAELGFDEQNTIFVFIGDHGEGLNHPRSHANGHGNYLYPSAVHVPMVITGPGISAGTEVLGLTSQVDLVPTVMGLIDWEPDPVLPGQDLSQMVTGGGGVSGRESHFVTTWFREVQRAAIYTEELMCQRDFDPEGTEKMLARTKKKGVTKPPFVDGCFDWRRQSAFDEAPVESFSQVKRLNGWFSQQTAVAKSLLDTREQVVVDSDLNAQLEALGYVE